MAIPRFHFEQQVSAFGAKHDKLEIEIDGRFCGDADDVISFVDYLGCPPEHLRDSPLFSQYGKYFNRPGSLQPPFQDQELRNSVLTLGGQRFYPPLVLGSLKVKRLHAGLWRLLLIASLNPTRFVRHQQVPSRQSLFHGQLDPVPNPFRRDISGSFGGEFSYCENDNWIPASPTWQFFASGTFWPRHLAGCVDTLNLLIADLGRAANHAQGNVHPAQIFNVRHVETYWEFLHNDPLGLVFELHNLVKLFSRRRVKARIFDTPPNLDEDENALVLTLQTRVGEWIKIYAKTNRRIRIEVTHILSGPKGFEPPTGRHTFAMTSEVMPFLEALTEAATYRVNELLQHFQNHSYVPETHATLLMFIEQMQAGCQSVEIAHELLVIMASQGSFVVGGSSPISKLFQDALRRLVRNEVLWTSNQRYSVTPFYKKALANLRKRGTDFLLESL